MCPLETIIGSLSSVSGLLSTRFSRTRNFALVHGKKQNKRKGGKINIAKVKNGKTIQRLLSRDNNPNEIFLSCLSGKKTYEAQRIQIRLK